MSNKIHQPHDKIFKTAMADLRVAKDFLQEHLPESIQKQIQWDSLQLKKDSFIDDDLKSSAADRVYSINMADQQGYIYILVEMQSTKDTFLAFRLLKYMFRIMQSHLDQYPKGPLPVVYPLVFYAGEKPYGEEINFFNLFAKSQQPLAQNIFRHPFQLIDVQTIEDAELRQYLWAGILEFIFKYRFTQNFLPRIKETMQWIHEIEVHEGFDYGLVLIKYIFDQMENRDKQKAIEVAKECLSPQLGEKTMTLAEQFREEGRQEGLQKANTLAEQFREEGRLEGRQEGLRKANTLAEQFREEGRLEGRQKGLLEGQLEVVKKLVSAGFNAKQIQEITGIKLEEIETE